MAGAFPDLVAAVKAVLEADPPVSPLIWVNRKRTIPDEATSALVVRLVSSDPEEGAVEGAPVEWATDMTIECYAAGDDEEGVLQALHDLSAQAWSRLLADPTLGGRAMGIELGRMEWDSETTGESLGAQILNFTVLHQTAGGNLESQTP